MRAEFHRGSRRAGSGPARTPTATFAVAPAMLYALLALVMLLSLVALLTPLDD
ncbi:MAG: hypothetical protein ACR2MU_03065 [Gaiellaceae bacterium]